jgi:hypothetical protein
MNNGKMRRFFLAGVIILCVSVLAINIKAAANNTAEKSAVPTGIAVPKEMEQFIKFQSIDSGMNYDRLKQTIKKDQLPLLYKLLDSNDYAPYWHNIARMIGYISNDPNSIPVLLKYYQRDDGAKVESIGGKIWSIALIGKIGSEKANPILKKAITKEGAEELAKSWLNEGKWKRSEIITKDRVITSTQSAALDGLVFTGKKENWDIVEKLYNEQKEISIKNGKQTEIMSALVDAMAKKGIIADSNNVVDAYFRIDSQVMGMTLRPYIEKYTLLNTLNKP